MVVGELLEATMRVGPRLDESLFGGLEEHESATRDSGVDRILFTMVMGEYPDVMDVFCLWIVQLSLCIFLLIPVQVGL